MNDDMQYTSSDLDLVRNHCAWMNEGRVGTSGPRFVVVALARVT